MFVIALAMSLRPGAYPRYMAAHEALWPEIAASMADNHVSMAIYRDGQRLVLWAVAPTEGHWEKSRQAPALARWDAPMAQWLETGPDGRIAFSRLEKVFGFGDFR